MATHTREQYVFLAKLAEQAERYDGTDKYDIVLACLYKFNTLVFRNRL